MNEKRLKVIYIVGPFRGPNAWEIEQNIRRAEAVALEVWRLGAVALCPHCNTRFFQGAAPDEIWLAGDLELMRRCDAVLLVPGWMASKGSCAEVADAKARGQPVLGEIENGLTMLRAWLEREKVAA